MFDRPLRLNNPSGWMPFLVLLAACLPLSGLAQMPVPLLSLGERDWSPTNTCADAPGACSGETWDIDLGMHEFVLSRVTWMEPVDAVDVTLHWPAGWSFLGWQSCAGTLVSGDPSVPGSLLHFTFPGCPGDEAFLRVWMDCPVPGTFSASPTSPFSCWGYPTEEYMGLYVDIGDWCGAAPHGHCDLCAYEGGAGYFVPGSVDVTLTAGTIWSDTLLVSGNTGPNCPGLPECGCNYGAGFTGITAEPPWAQVTLLDYQPNHNYLQMHYRLVIRGDQLAAGEHTGRITAQSGCCTRENCIPIVVHVLGAEEVAEPRAATGLLSSVRPNPTSGAILYAVRLPAPGRVRVTVVDAAGRQVAIAADRDLPAGSSDLRWQSSAALRAHLTNGIYFLRVESAAGCDARPFVLRR